MVKNFHLQKNIYTVEEIKKEYFLNYHLMLLSLAAIHFLLFQIGEETILRNFTILIIFLEVLVYFYIRQIDYSVLRHFVSLYFIFTGLFLAIIVFCIWDTASYSFIFFLLIPLGMYRIYTRPTILYTFIIISILFCSFVILPKEIYPDIVKNKSQLIAFTKVILSFSIVGIYIIYYNNKINSFHKDLYSNHGEEIQLENYAKQEIIKNLYKQILNYFNENQPWKECDYTIQDLAAELGTNTTYISRAINQNTKMNFNTFINKYRIEYIKNEIEENHINKRYKLIHIYNSAGFKHQSTFNKAFKQFMKMTPSEYINSQKNIKV